MKPKLTAKEPMRTTLKEIKVRLSLLVKDIHAWMKKDKIDAKLKVTRDGDSYINTKDGEGYRKLQDILERENIVFYNYNEK